MNEKRFSIKISIKGFAILSLVIIIIALAGYISYDKIQEKRQQTLQDALQLGYESAILQLAGELPKCQPIPITANNQTFNVIATECLQFQQLNSTNNQ